MRRLLIGTLDLFRRARLGWRKLRGRTEADVHAEATVSGQAWAEYCDTLKSAGAALQFPGTPQDPFNQAEGYRYLSRLVRAGLEAFIEHGDVYAPELHRLCHETIKIGADNPDNYYQSCNLDGAYTYRVTGTRGTVAYLSFATKSGHYGDGNLAMPPVGEIDAKEMEFDADGRFELILSRERQRGNWLPLPEGYALFIVRQTHLDRETEQIADLTIECLDGPPHEAGKFSPEKLVSGLQSAGKFVAGAPLLFAKWANDMQKHSNQLPQFSDEVSNRAGGDPNIAYYHSHWALAPDEALVIEVMPPECEHWNFQLNNYWMESLDYSRHRIHTNKHLATYHEDGSVTVIVAHEDPGLPQTNWISTVGHQDGTMCWRWVRPDRRIEPSTRVVKLADLKLPMAAE
ncbi:MAG: DUF1214 domain-containing protein [Pseudomonadota bacterium]